MWSDRKKKIKVPLLPRIIFVSATEEQRNTVFDLPGTVNYLYDHGKPGIVRGEEINYLKNNLKNLDIQSHSVEPITLGKTLPLVDFGIENQEGLIVKTTKNNVWVVLKSVGFFVNLQLNQ